jgi:hypothetical protein
MKAIYVSDEGDERSRPNSSIFAFRGHTYVLELNKFNIRYVFNDYMPEYGCSHWHDSPEGYRCFLSDEIDMDADLYRKELHAYDLNFQRSSYFGGDFTKKRGFKFGNLCVVSEEEGDLHYERLYEDLGCRALSEIHEFSNSYLYVIDNLLILTDHPRGILSVDKNFSVNWKVEFSNIDPRYTRIAFFQYKNSAIASLGSTYRDAGDGQIISVHTENGDTLWLRDVPFVVDYCTLVGDRIYLSGRDDWQWYILSADTGEILLEDSINFEDEDADLGRLWSHDGFLFLYLRYNVLRIMDETTGRVLQDIPIPEEFILSLGFYPEVIGDYIYIRLSNGGGIERMSTYGGVMILPREELKQGFPINIEVEDKGDISHQAIEDGKNEYYEITASYEELGDVLRFGQIEIKLVAQRFAYNHWGNLDNNWKTRINKKFDGRMVFNVDKAKLKNPDDSKFDLMVELFNKHFAEKFRAPANKKPLTIEWRYI